VTAPVLDAIWNYISGVGTTDDGECGYLYMRDGTFTAYANVEGIIKRTPQLRGRHEAQVEAATLLSLVREERDKQKPGTLSRFDMILERSPTGADAPESLQAQNAALKAKILEVRSYLTSFDPYTALQDLRRILGDDNTT
jgi:hypothetical protein